MFLYLIHSICLSEHVEGTSGVCVCAMMRIYCQKILLGPWLRANTTSKEQDFPWLDFAASISLDTSLIQWCRTKLRQSDEHPLIFPGALHILLSAMKNAASTSTQNQNEKILAGGVETSSIGFASNPSSCSNGCNTDMESAES
jgi:hypothetical protein